jgi:hypothetical protein
MRHRPGSGHRNAASSVVHSTATRNRCGSFRVRARALACAGGLAVPGPAWAAVPFQRSRSRHRPPRQAPPRPPRPAPARPLARPAPRGRTRSISETARTAPPVTPAPASPEPHRNVASLLSWAPQCDIAVHRAAGRAHHGHHPPRTPGARSTTATPIWHCRGSGHRDVASSCFRAHCFRAPRCGIAVVQGSGSGHRDVISQWLRPAAGRTTGTVHPVPECSVQPSIPYPSARSRIATRMIHQHHWQSARD